jgi:hypothetical protein
MTETNAGNQAQPLTLFVPIAAQADPLQLLKLLSDNRGKNNAALTEIGTVHFARFVLLDRSKPNLKFDPSNPGENTGQFVLGVITEYDGSFKNYVGDFVVKIGDVFNALIKFSADGQELYPVQDHLDEFTAYVANNDVTNGHPEALYAAYPSSVQQILHPSDS